MSGIVSDTKNSKHKYSFTTLTPVSRPGVRIKQKLLAKQTLYSNQWFTNEQLRAMGKAWLQSIQTIIPTQVESELIINHRFSS